MTGAADGSIIPTIITAHIANSANQSETPHVRMVIAVIPIAACTRASAVMAVIAADSRSRYVQARPIAVTSPSATHSLSRRMRTSTDDLGFMNA